MEKDTINDIIEIFRKFNANHEPAGTSIGGQFASSETTEDRIKKIEEKTGLKFTKSKTTESYYNNENLIRLSDHASKYSDRLDNLGHLNSLDLNYTYYSTDAIIHLVNKTNPFIKYRVGDSIIHSYEKITGLKYISSEFTKGYVEVKNSEGKVIKYDMHRFLSKKTIL